MGPRALLQSQARGIGMGNKKWYSYFIVTDEPADSTGSPEPGDLAPRRVADVAPEGDAPAFDTPVEGPADFASVYESAKIAPPPHGYTVFKVADMLENEHIKTLPADVKRKSVLVALDAANVKVGDIIEDAVRRDRALDTYERVLEKHLDGVRAQMTAENQQLEEEITRRVAELRGRVEANREAVAREERELQAWRTRKQQEEDAIARTVSYFVSENPITSSPVSGTDKGERNVR